MHQAGLLDRAVQMARMKDAKNPCSLNSKNKQQENQPILLELHDFSGAFFVLNVGMGLAFIILIVEIIIGKFR